MLNTITIQSNHSFSHYPTDSVKNRIISYRYKQPLSVCGTSKLSVFETNNRFAKIPEKMPYQHHPMTQISSSLIDALPIIENL